jgi:hypothetical protein
MSLRRLRLASPVLLATAGLAVAGCGGGSGGDEASYVKTYEGACKAVTTAGTEFTTSVSSIASTAAKDPDGAVKTLKDGVTKVFDTFGKQIQVMADADAPKKWEDFQKSVSDSADGAKKGIDKAKDAVAGVKSVQDFSKLGSVFQNIDIGKGTKNMPKDLAAKAPSCKSLGGGSAAS